MGSLFFASLSACSSERESEQILWTPTVWELSMWATASLIARSSPRYTEIFLGYVLDRRVVQVVPSLDTTAVRKWLSPNFDASVYSDATKLSCFIVDQVPYSRATGDDARMRFSRMIKICQRYFYHIVVLFQTAMFPTGAGPLNARCVRCRRVVFFQYLSYADSLVDIGITHRVIELAHRSFLNPELNWHKSC